MKSFASPNAAIVAALTALFPKDTVGNHPIGHLKYTGPAAQYCIFKTSNRLAEVIGSGKNQVVGCYGYIDYFSTTDDSGAGKKIALIETALRAAGFKVTDVSDSGIDEVTGQFHTEFSIYLAVAV